MSVFAPKPIFYVPFETPWLDNWGVVCGLTRLLAETDASYRQRLLGGLIYVPRRKLEVI